MTSLYATVGLFCQHHLIPWVRPNFGINVPGTGEEMVRLRTISSPVPGT